MEKLWTKDFLIISMSNFIFYLVYYSFMIIVAMYAIQELGTTHSQAGLTVGVFMISALVFRIISGKYIEIVGRKRMLLVGTAVFIIGTALYFTVHSVQVLYAVRLFHGIGFGITTTAASTIAAIITPAKRLGEGLSFFMMSTVLASAVGSLLGMYIYRFNGVYAVSAVGLALLGLCLAGSLFLAIPEQAHGEKNRQDSHIGVQGTTFRYWLASYFEIKALPISAIGLIVFFSYSSIIGFIATYATNLGLPEGASFYFFVYSVALLLSRPFTGKLFDRKGADFVLYPSFIILALGFILVSQAYSNFLLLLSAAFVGIGFGTFTASARTVAVEGLPDSRMGMATATYLAISEIGVGLGPYFVGIFISFIGFRTMYLCMFLCVMLSFLLYRQFVSRKRKKQ